jgi:hypothetical protein
MEAECSKLEQSSFSLQRPTWESSLAAPEQRAVRESSAFQEIKRPCQQLVKKKQNSTLRTILCYSVRVRGRMQPACVLCLTLWGAPPSAGGGVAIGRMKLL